MRRRRAPLFVAGAVAGCLATGAAPAAGGGLSEEPAVTNGLVALGAADEIRRNCSEIAPRWIAAWRFLRSLEQAAREAGYSDAEIDAYVEDDDERDRLEGVAHRYLVEEGVREGDGASYCAVGRDHIARKTRIGLLLTTR